MFWDMIDDEANIFVPVVLAEGSGVNAMYIEAIKNPDKTTTNSLRVFINKDEADSYKISKKPRKIAIAQTTVGYLTNSLSRNWGGRLDRKIDCVLSTIDITGKICSIETLWSNTLKPN